MDNFIPKIGEECTFQGNKLLVTAVGEKCVLAKTSEFLEELKLPICDLRPIKSHAEIERENTVNTMLEINGYPSGYEGDMYRFMNRLYDEGYRKQQVKPLNLTKFVAIRLESATVQVNYQQLLDGGFIIQGDDK